MPLKVTKIDVWSGEIQDQPGGLAGVLRQLAGASANLEMVVARRQPDRPMGRSGELKPESHSH
jgi:hypothetical protein